MEMRLISLARKALGKPPRVVAYRLRQEIRRHTDTWRLPHRIAAFTPQNLLDQLQTSSFESLWKELSERPFPIRFQEIRASEYGEENVRAVLKAADRVLDQQVELLGVERHLNLPQDWHRDPISDQSWSTGFFTTLHYGDPHSGRDVKHPWELSRLQWALPLAQAYAVTGDDRYARKTREYLESWMQANPVAQSINWSCTMEVALRILTWTTLFHAFAHAESWKDTLFRERFLHHLFWHADFTYRYLELSDINGNHYTADLTGLYFAALFFGKGAAAQRWLRYAQKELERELPRQVTADGVDFEASTSYHRLVMELFLLPALYAQRQGLSFSQSYHNRLKTMARFVSAYENSGEAPTWGDADDARALPLGTQPLNDHRYLIDMVRLLEGPHENLEVSAEAWSELFWFSPKVRKRSQEPPLCSRVFHFSEGGVVIFQTPKDHLFVDCGPVGLAGRGGHGHNDCLSFTARLNGQNLFVDSGCLVYTGSYSLRNAFRATAAHNTPIIDATEMNTLRWDHLWTLANEAKPLDIAVTQTEQELVFSGSHTGYLKLSQPVKVSRSLRLNPSQHVLEVHDTFLGEGSHLVQIPFHLHPEIQVHEKDGNLLLEAPHGRFMMTLLSAHSWSRKLLPALYAPSYGRGLVSQKILWERNGTLCDFSLRITPCEAS